MTLPAVEAYSRQGTHMMYVVLVRIYFEVVLSTTYNAASTRSYGCSFFFLLELTCAYLALFRRGSCVLVHRRSYCPNFRALRATTRYRLILAKTRV